MVTIPRRNVPVVCGASYHLLGYRISQDSKIRFRLQVKSYTSDWLFSESRLLASYVSRHKAMAYDTLVGEVKDYLWIQRRQLGAAGEGRGGRLRQWQRERSNAKTMCGVSSIVLC